MMVGATVAGVDGANSQWLVAIVRSGACTTHRAADFADVAALVADAAAAAVGVDMPIGLPERGHRASDQHARDLLGPRRTTLFTTPPASILDAVDYAEANQLHRQLTGKGMSKQAFNLVPAIRQVRTVVAVAPPGLFHESHPETTFAAIAGRPLPPKRTAAGVGARLALLGRFVDDPVSVLATAPTGAAPHDVLDAMAAAWSASRWIGGEALVLGAGLDAQGHPLHMIV